MPSGEKTKLLWKNSEYRNLMSNSHIGKMVGKNHPRWKGGKYICSQGYVMVYRPKHPFPNHPDGYVFEHRLVMEKILGRYLKPEERVHHINEIKTDNGKENLQLFPNHSAHQKFHIPKGVCIKNH